MSNKKQTAVDLLIEMKTFEEYLDKMGFSWNDFDRTYEMEGLIEQYANERIKQAKEMEKEQIIDAYKKGYIDGECNATDITILQRNL